MSWSIVARPYEGAVRERGEAAATAGMWRAAESYARLTSDPKAMRRRYATRPAAEAAIAAIVAAGDDDGAELLLDVECL